MNKVRRNIIYLMVLGIPLVVYTQDPIKVGIWERFDAQILPEKNHYPTQEIINQKDDDHNGFVDDLIGIGFDASVTVQIEDFMPDSSERERYEHGTAVTSLFLENCKVPTQIVGVGFEYTSDQLESLGVRELSVTERKKNLRSEFKLMQRFVEESLSYFQQKEVQIINISWGLNQDGMAELNPNFGYTSAQRKKTAYKWLKKFKKYMQKGMKKHSDILFVVATGNEGKDINQIYDVPANINLDNVIVVGGLNFKQNGPASFSNTGQNIDCWAPSEIIRYQSTDGKTKIADGVSLSAPMVSAKIAEYLYKGMKINKTQAKTIINTIKTK